jgi:hypothetical protein
LAGRRRRSNLLSFAGGRRHPSLFLRAP